MMYFLPYQGKCYDELPYITRHIYAGFPYITGHIYTVFPYITEHIYANFPYITGHMFNVVLNNLTEHVIKLIGGELNIFNFCTLL